MVIPRSATLGDILEEKAQALGDKVFINCLADGSHRRTATIGSQLIAMGIEFGSHVAILMDNCPEQLLCLWGIGRAGLVAVSVNTAAKGHLLTYFLNHSDSVALIVEEALLERFVNVVQDCPRIRHVFVARVTGRASAITALSQPANLGRAAEALASTGATLLSFDEMNAADFEKSPCKPRFNDVAMLMYTSGTTGPSKAIMFSHASLIYWGSDVAVQNEYVPEDIAYVFLPIFHGNALLSATLPALLANASIALAPRFSTRSFWNDVRRSGATVFNGLGPIAHFLWESPPSAADREHRVNRCHLVPVPGFAKGFQERFGLRIFSAYGLTDYCRGAAYNSRCTPGKLGSAGLPIPEVELGIVDEDDFEVPCGTHGEIVMRNNVPWGASPGYYKEVEATLATRRNLWFHTGDRGWLDADGYLWYSDRIKDSIRRRGENISSFEVEEVIRTHAAVLEVAVYPVRAQASEDEVAASLILRPGVAFSPRELLEHCNANLAHFMVPRYIDIVESMPMTPSHKIEKYKLRQKAEENLDALWDREREGVQITR